MTRRSWLALAYIAPLTGCAESALSARQQECLECAVRAHSDPAAAREAAAGLEAQCAAGEARSCSVLGVMYEHGQGVPLSASRAEHLYRVACLSQNAPSCVHLGRLLCNGTAGRRDREGAAVVFEVACHEGDPDGCYELGRLRYEAGDPEAAATALRRACKKSQPDACFALGAMHHHGHGLPRDEARARRYYTKACAHGHAPACRRATLPPALSAAALTPSRRP